MTSDTDELSTQLAAQKKMVLESVGDDPAVDIDDFEYWVDVETYHDLLTTDPTFDPDDGGFEGHRVNTLNNAATHPTDDRTACFLPRDLSDYPNEIQFLSNPPKAHVEDFIEAHERVEQYSDPTRHAEVERHAVRVPIEVRSETYAYTPDAIPDDAETPFITELEHMPGINARSLEDATDGNQSVSTDHYSITHINDDSEGEVRIEIDYVDRMYVPLQKFGYRVTSTAEEVRRGLVEHQLERQHRTLCQSIQEAAWGQADRNLIAYTDREQTPTNDELTGYRDTNPDTSPETQTSETVVGTHRIEYGDVYLGEFVRAEHSRERFEEIAVLV